MKEAALHKQKINLTFLCSILLHGSLLLVASRLPEFKVNSEPPKRLIKLSFVTLSKPKPIAIISEKEMAPIPAMAPASAPKIAVEEIKTKQSKAVKPKADISTIRKSAPSTPVVAKAKVAPVVAPMAPIRKFNFSQQVKGILADQGPKNGRKAIAESTTDKRRRDTTSSFGATGVSTTSNKDLAFAKTADSQGGGVARRGIISDQEANSMDTSTGARGIVNKTGFSLSNIGNKTVLVGSIDPAIVQRILKEKLPELSYCYDDEVTRQGSKISGLATLEFVIGTSGNVIQSNVVSKNLNLSSSATGCIKKILGRLKFPRPKGENNVTVKQPLNFTA